MRQAILLSLQLWALSAFAVQAPLDWKQVQGEKEFTGLAMPLRQLGVWRSTNGEVIVQILQMQPITDPQGVWNVVGGNVSGLTKAGLAPTSSTVVYDTPHIVFRLSGQGKQENGATGPLDNYIVFTGSATYMVKVFSTSSISEFVFTDWDFGAPARQNREELSNALAQIKDRLDRGVSLAKPSPAPSVSKEEKWESAQNATDDELRSDLRVWTSVVDDMKAHAINAAKREGRPPPNLDEELKPIYRRAANNKFFNIGREEGLHPGYQHELAQIAALRGEKYRGGSPEYQLAYFAARYGVSLGLLIFLISRWTRRVARKTDHRADQSRAAYYGKLLLKMSWRVVLLIVLSFGLVILSHLRPGLSDSELQSAFAITFLLLILVVPAAYLLTSWSQTKRRFAMQPALATGEYAVPLPQTSGSSVAVAKALDRTDSGSRPNVEMPQRERDKSQDTQKRRSSTWWKRLFTVVEIAVFVASVGVVLLLLREITIGPLVFILLVPIALAHLLRLAIIYVVEGKKPFSRHD
jgi:hypothetical protein